MRVPRGPTCVPHIRCFTVCVLLLAAMCWDTSCLTNATTVLPPHLFSELCRASVACCVCPNSIQTCCSHGLFIALAACVQGGGSKGESKGGTKTKTTSNTKTKAKTASPAAAARGSKTAAGRKRGKRSKAAESDDEDNQGSDDE